MSASGYEIRHSILNEAREMSYEQWHKAMEIEQVSAEFEKRVPRLLPAPTLDEIKKLAEGLYEFVQTKS
jgi:hypothetical protein